VDLTDLASTAAVKIRTTASGVHFLPADTLAGVLGQTATEVAGWITAGRIAVWNQGEPVGYVPGTGNGRGAVFLRGSPPQTTTRRRTFTVAPRG